LEQILSQMTAVAEGVRTTRSVNDLALKHNLDMPITREVHAVLFEGKPPACTQTGPVSIKTSANKPERQSALAIANLMRSG